MTPEVDAILLRGTRSLDGSMLVGGFKDVLYLPSISATKDDVIIYQVRRSRRVQRIPGTGALCPHTPHRLYFQITSCAFTLSFQDADIPCNRLNISITQRTIPPLLVAPLAVNDPGILAQISAAATTTGPKRAMPVADVYRAAAASKLLPLASWSRASVASPTASTAASGSRRLLRLLADSPSATASPLPLVTLVSNTSTCPESWTQALLPAGTCAPCQIPNRPSIAATWFEPWMLFVAWDTPDTLQSEGSLTFRTSSAIASTANNRSISRRLTWADADVILQSRQFTDVELLGVLPTGVSIVDYIQPGYTGMSSVWYDGADNKAGDVPSPSALQGVLVMGVQALKSHTVPPLFLTQAPSRGTVTFSPILLRACDGCTANSVMPGCLRLGKATYVPTNASLPSAYRLCFVKYTPQSGACGRRFDKFVLSYGQGTTASIGITMSLTCPPLRGVNSAFFVVVPILAVLAWGVKIAAVAALMCLRSTLAMRRTRRYFALAMAGGLFLACLQSLEVTYAAPDALNCGLARVLYAASYALTVDATVVACYRVFHLLIQVSGTPCGRR